MNRAKPKLVHIVTSPITAWAFLRGQLRFMREHGFDVTLISSPGTELQRIGEREGITTFPLPMRREPSPYRDYVSLARLTFLLRSLQPDIVHTGTPKAALLGGIAAFLAGVPIRLMTLHGLRADGLRQPSQSVMLAMERMSCRSVQRVYCVGESLRQRALELRIASPEKLRILGNGTANGIDGEYFSPSPDVLSRATVLRERLSLSVDTPVIGFVGRLVRDKGVAELITAFQQLKSKQPDLRLLLVGAFEEYDGLPAEIRATIDDDPQINHLGFLDDPRPAYHLMKVLALPSYREGFPYVPMEAAAMGLPVVTTRVTGCVDAVLDQKTGLIVPPRDPQALANALQAYLVSPELANSHGASGRRRVLSDFSPELVWESLERDYQELLHLTVRSKSVDTQDERHPTALNLTLKESRIE